MGVGCWRLVLPLSLCYRFDDVDFGMENIHPSAFLLDTKCLIYMDRERIPLPVFAERIQ
jgi:hypothetical protein